MPVRTSKGSFRFCFTALLSAFLLSAGMLLVSAYALVQLELPQKLAAVLAVFSVCAGAMVGAWLMSFLKGNSGLLCGSIVGGGYSSLLLLGSAGSGTAEVVVLLYCGLILLCCWVGGYCGVLAAEKKRRRHR